MSKNKNIEIKEKNIYIYYIICTKNKKLPPADEKELKRRIEKAYEKYKKNQSVNKKEEEEMNVKIKSNWKFDNNSDDSIIIRDVVAKTETEYAKRIYFELKKQEDETIYENLYRKNKKIEKLNKKLLKEKQIKENMFCLWKLFREEDDDIIDSTIVIFTPIEKKIIKEYYDDPLRYPLEID